MKIALISDTHLAPVAQDFNANGAVACAWIDQIGADLGVHLGDVTADGVVFPDHYQTSRAVLGALRTPLKVLPGNHDIGDNPRPGHATGGEPAVQAAALARYRETFGPDRWTVVAGDWTLIGLNAQLFGLGDAEETAQTEWLDAALTAARGPIGLMLHKPLFRTEPGDGDAHHRYVPPAPRLRLFEQLAGHDLRFVVSGHTHQTRRLIHEGVEHVWAPSTAFIIPDRLQERIGQKVVATMTLTLAPDSHRFDLANPQGLRQLDLGDYASIYPRLGTRG